MKADLPSVDIEALAPERVSRFVRSISEMTKVDPAAVLFSAIARFAAEVGPEPFVDVVGKVRLRAVASCVVVGGAGRSRMLGMVGHIASCLALGTWKSPGGEGVKPYYDRVWMVDGAPHPTDKGTYFHMAQTILDASRGIDSGGIDPLFQDNIPARHVCTIGIVRGDSLYKSAFRPGEICRKAAPKFLWVRAMPPPVVCPFWKKGAPLPDPDEFRDLFHAAIRASVRAKVNISWEARETFLAAKVESPQSRTGFLREVLWYAHPQIFQLALLYTLMDNAEFVTGEHMRKAIMTWRYAEESARRFFGSWAGMPDAGVDPGGPEKTMPASAVAGIEQRKMKGDVLKIDSRLRIRDQR